MLKGPTSTLSSGTASYLVALNYAVELLNCGMADAIIMVGADECHDAHIMGTDKVGLMSRSKFAPLTDKADGMVLSPGSVAVMLETEKHALERNANIIAAIKGYAATSDNYGLADIDPEGTELYECVKRAIEDSKAESIDLYVNAAIGVPNCDSADINALKKLIDDGIFRSDIACSAVSPLLGVASGTNSGYSLLSVLYSFLHQEVIGVSADVKDSVRANYSKENRKKDLNTACISTMGLGGAYSSIVIEKY